MESKRDAVIERLELAIVRVKAGEFDNAHGLIELAEGLLADLASDADDRAAITDPDDEDDETGIINRQS